MNETYTFEDIDDVVWQSLQGSENAQDYLTYVKTTMGYKAHQKEALQLAHQHWNGPESPSFFAKALNAVTAIANTPNTAAMAHLGRWYRLGTGVSIDLELSRQWYQKAVDLKDGKGHNGLGRLCFKTAPATAAAHFYLAIEMGELTGYSHLADIDRKNELEHLKNALQTGEAFDDFSYGQYLIRNAKTDEEKESHIHWIAKAAKKGYGFAAFHMALHHFKENSEDDPTHETAKEWCRMGCDAGEVAALVWFGYRFIDSNESHEEAQGYLKSACMLGDPYAQSFYGAWLVSHGKSFEAQAQGVAWLRSAVDQGHSSAICPLSDALRRGKGTEVNLKEAHNLMVQGADLGISECQCHLGIDYMYGDQVPMDKERAHDWFQIASLQGDLWATYLLGMTYEAGDGVAQDHAKAFECFMQASKAEFPGAFFRIGRALLRGHGVPINKPGGVKWLLKAANADSTDAMIVLGATLMSGDGVQVNETLGASWFQKAAELGSPEAMYELATFHMDGDGVEQDPGKVKHWMFKAAGLGHPQAVEWVNDNFPNQPRWLQDLKKGIQELPHDPVESPKTSDDAKPVDKDKQE